MCKENDPCPRCADELGGVVTTYNGTLSCDECDWEVPPPCDQCGGEMSRDNTCGVAVCDSCGNHKGLARCYCGWSASGGDGYRELQEMGEQIDPD